MQTLHGPIRALVGAALLAVGCDASPVTCGPGTHLEGRVCVSDFNGDAGPLADAAMPPDAWAGDAAPELREGDPCPTDAEGHNLLPAGCAGTFLRFCNGNRVHTIDCAELGDTCVEGTLPRCQGGVYGACDLATMPRACADRTHVLVCATGWPYEPNFFYSSDCTSFGADWTCIEAAGEFGCAPPP